MSHLAVDLDEAEYEAELQHQRAIGVITWTSTGVLLAGILPGIPMLLMAPEMPPFAMFVVGSLLVGLLGGVLLGLMRPIHRMAQWLTAAGRQHMITPLGLIVGFVLGMLWGGAAGSVGGAFVGATIAILEPSGMDGLVVVVMAAVLGTMPAWTLGGVGVAIAGGVRAVQVQTGGPWFLPALAGAAGAVGFFGWGIGALFAFALALEALA